MCVEVINPRTEVQPGVTGWAGRKKKMIGFIWKLLTLEAGLWTAAWRCPVASGRPGLSWRHRSGACQQAGAADILDQTESI